MLSPINIAGPDQRRKQLVQKLSQQSQQHGSVPMPPGQHGSASALGAGVNFKSPGMRALPGVQNTNGNNVLASILARLGIGGRAQDNEMSNGIGSPISPYGPHYIPPSAATAGSPIPAGGGPGQISPPPPGPIGSTWAQTISGGQTNSSLPADQQLSGVDPGANVIGGPNQVAAPNAFGNPNSPVPLGGGLYYDPSSGQIMNFGPNAGAAALLGGVGHATA